MPLTIASRDIYSAMIMDVSGKLCHGETALSEAVSVLLKEGHRRIVINLKGITQMDSFGLGELVNVWNMGEKQGGKISFMRPSSRVTQHLNLLKLNTIFQVSGDDTNTVQHLVAPPKPPKDGKDN